MIRGLERREIFLDDDDRWDLVDRLCRLVPKWGGVCLVWVFMGNHVHLLVQTRALPLAWLMRRLNTGFALRFNQRHARVGYLFQDRFKSRLVGEDEDVRVLIRYVQLNPLRGKLVEDAARLERYPWSSYPALLGHRTAFAFESVDRTLELFGERPRDSRRSLRAWMAAEVEHESASDVGEHAHVAVPDQVLEAAAEPGTGGALCEPGSASLDDLVDRVTSHFLVSREEVTRGARHERACRARAVIAFVAVVRQRIPATRLAGLLGVSTQAICKALERGARLAAEEDLVPPGHQVD